jgi:hypothetical protein
MTLENDYKLASQEVYRRFISSLPSEITKEYYRIWLHYFMDWLHIDREEYEGLKTLIVNVKQITREKTRDLTHEQMKELFNSLRKIQKGRSF